LNKRGKKRKVLFMSEKPINQNTEANPDQFGDLAAQKAKDMIDTGQGLYISPEEELKIKKTIPTIHVEPNLTKYNYDDDAFHDNEVGEVATELYSRHLKGDPTAIDESRTHYDQNNEAYRNQAAMDITSAGIDLNEPMRISVKTNVISENNANRNLNVNQSDEHFADYFALRHAEQARRRYGEAQTPTPTPKERALELVENGQLKNAVMSIASDLVKDTKRPDEQKALIVRMSAALRADPDLTQEKVREFINGFN